MLSLLLPAHPWSLHLQPSSQTTHEEAGSLQPSTHLLTYPFAPAAGHCVEPPGSRPRLADNKAPIVLLPSLGASDSSLCFTGP